MINSFRFLAILTFVILHAVPGHGQQLIPQPSELAYAEGRFTITPETVIVPHESDDLAGYLNDHIERVCGFRLQTVPHTPETNYISLRRGGHLGNEAYTLSIEPEHIIIRGGDRGGVFYGLQTLFQLLPPEVYGQSVASAPQPLTLDAVSVKDSPRYAYRGAMLDVSRTFFDKQAVMQYLDWMSRHKLNKFHWHLTDDQGWRIEIRRYPDLTGKGAWRHFNKQDTICTGRARRELNDDFLLPEKRLRTEGADTLYGGCYTQRDIREIVSYAAARGIDVIPEIDMPGHFLQAIEHYPWLTCFRPETWSEQAFSSPLCLGRDDVLRFCEEIWEEVFELFPYEYVHIGGDEVNMKNWNRCPRCRARMRAEGLADSHALQAWFTRRMQRFFTEHGRRMIGWDELLADEVDPATTIMWWRPWEPQSVSDATRRGCDVIVSAQSWFYFSLEEDAGSLARTAGFEIRPDSLSDEQKARIKGIQGHLWTEKVPSWSRAEYMLYPRLLIVAEKGWCAPERVSEESLMPRLLRYCERLDAEGINYRIPSLRNYHEFCVFTDSVRTTAECPLPTAILRYTLDGSVPTAASQRYTGPMTFRDDATLRLRAFHADGRTGDWVTIRYEKCGFARPAEPRETQPGLLAEWYFKRFPDCAAIGGAQADGRCVADSVHFPQ
ncbi:beta-N-acetylhexosaminidase, partial [Alistipes indistinctus]|uniref:beta-N-acetylhexosaminidase n=1 Tax=Alistipes indistinctus TaxID=626932 RepID=UPI002675750D